MSDYRGFRREDFTLGNRNCFIAYPNKEADGKKWIWRAEFPGAFDTVDVDLMNKGYHLAYIGLSDMYGCPESVEEMKGFYDEMVRRGFNKKTVLFGFSRGGLYSVNYALKYPETVAALYLDAPVLDLKSWPGGLMTGLGAEREFEQVLGILGLDRQSILVYNKNPVDRIDELIEDKIPVALVAGDSDKVVPYTENGEFLEKAYKKAGAKLLCIVKPGCDHHPHSIEEPKPVSEFLMGIY